MKIDLGKSVLFLISSCCVIIHYDPAIAQGLPADSAALFTAVDTNLVSIPSDSSAAAAKPDTNRGLQLAAPIYYWADQGGISWDKNKIYLKGNAKIVYQEMTLQAASIMIDQENHYLFAEGIVDTVDSLGNPVYKGTPVFTEQGEEPIYGNTLHYDFKTKRGKVNYGKTQMPPGYYKGQKINKISDKTLLVEDGYFTSCEYIDNPHFYFRSHKMRAEVKDRLIAQPVYLYIADVPLLAIPFGVFPNKRGRHSGIVVPNYGESSYGGRFLKNMGYYWAPSDFMDATFLTDFYDKLGFSYKADLSYNLLYSFNGDVGGYYLPRDPNTGSRRERWAFTVSHSQTIDPTLSINARGQFQSDRSLERELSSDINRRTNQLITSNLSINKKFRGTKNSLSVNLSRMENLKNGNISYTFPNARFSRTQTSLYELFGGNSTRDTRHWYQNINFNYDANLINRGDKTWVEAVADTGFRREQKRGLQHNISFNAPQKILKYFNLTPAINYQEVWVDEITRAKYDTSSQSIIESQVKQFASRRTFNTSFSFKTTLYGLLEPNIGSFKFLRHKMDPQISYTYTPDFTTPYWNYFNNVTGKGGKVSKIDKFKKNPFGGTPQANESQFMRISVNNLFQAKLINGDEEKKIDLFTLNFNTGYNFKADSLKWGNLNTSFRATPVQGISLDFSTTHSFYAAGPEKKGTINVLLPAKGKLPRLINLRASTSFALDNKIVEPKSKGKEETPAEEDLNEPDDLEDNSYIQTEKISDEKAAKALKIPWRVSFNFSYSYNPLFIKNGVVNPESRLDLSTNASVTLTKNWRINWSGRFDLMQPTIVYQSFSIYRDLHCWEMSFNWQPSNDYYSFQINVKESVLQDIKMTKHPAGRAYY
jgi:lipopolysaccharide assembly outer membrane protein LptD (OstA)